MNIRNKANVLVISNLTNYPTFVLTPYSIYEKRFSMITKEKKKKEKKHVILHSNMRNEKIRSRFVIVINRESIF